MSSVIVANERAGRMIYSSRKTPPLITEGFSSAALRKNDVVEWGELPKRLLRRETNKSQPTTRLGSPRAILSGVGF